MRDEWCVCEREVVVVVPSRNGDDVPHGVFATAKALNFHRPEAFLYQDLLVSLQTQRQGRVEGLWRAMP